MAWRWGDWKPQQPAMLLRRGECLRPLLESALDTVRLYHYRCEATRSVAWRANKTKCPERVQPEVVTAKAVYVVYMSVWCFLLCTSFAKRMPKLHTSARIQLAIYKSASEKEVLLWELVEDCGELTSLCARGMSGAQFGVGGAYPPDVLVPLWDVS